MKPLALILNGYGINCERETTFAFQQASARTRNVHFNLLAGEPNLLDNAQIFVIPGGFSFADDIASGKVLANKLKFRLQDALLRFLERDGLVLGICNGFQVLVKLGMLPGLSAFQQQVSLTENASSIFEDRWVHLTVTPGHPCVFLQGLDTLYLPVRHMEGNLVVPETVLEAVKAQHLDCLHYQQPGCDRAAYPYNPNGSTDDIAGMCDPTGRVLGLMPHPEAFNHVTNHPRFTGLKDTSSLVLGTALMRNAVAYFA